MNTKLALVAMVTVATVGLVHCQAKLDLGSRGGSDGGSGDDGLPTGGYTAPGGGGGTTADAITVLTKVHINPDGLVLDAHNVFWVDVNPLGGVYAVAKTGGQEVELATCADCAAATTTVDATAFYVATSTSIAKVPLNFDPPTTVAALDTAVGGVTRNNDNLFWIESATSLVSPDAGINNGSAIAKSVRLAGGAVVSIPLPAALDDVTDVNRFVFASTKAIYGSQRSRGIVRIAYDGSGTTLVPINTFPRGLASDDVDIFYADSVGVSMVPVGGGTPTLLAVGEAPYGVALDGDTIYWTDGTHGTEGRVFKMKKDGSNLTVLADHQESPTSIAVDSTSVYWIEFDEGKIKKLPK